MSVAFTREDSAQTAQEVSLPDRPISPHPNIVTEFWLGGAGGRPRGLAHRPGGGAADRG